MANLASISATSIHLKSGTLAAPTNTSDTTLRLTPITGGSTGEMLEGSVQKYHIATCYDSAANRVHAFYTDMATSQNGTTQNSYGVIGQPSADGESIIWHTPVWLAGNSGIHGNACSYDRYKQVSLWAASTFFQTNFSSNSLYTRTVFPVSGGGYPMSDTVTSYGGGALWAMPAAATAECLGPESLIYVGDDAGSSAGKHVLLYNHAASSLRAVVGTVSGSVGSAGTVDWNTPLTNYATLSTVSTNYQAHGCKVADNKIVAFWTNGSTEGWCRVGTVASGEITFGTAVRVDGGYADSGLGPGSESICFDAASGKVVLAWWEWDGNGSNKLMVRTGTVSGTGITLGTAYQIIAFATNTSAKVSVVYDENIQKSILYYKRRDTTDSGNPYKLFAKLGTISGTNISFGTEKLIEAPNTNYSFNRGPNNMFSHACCSTYVSDASVKKTLVIRAGSGYSGEAIGTSRSTLVHSHVSGLTVDLSVGNSFEVDLSAAKGTIKTFTINNTVATSGQVSSFTLKITRGYFPRETGFDWSVITNVKWDAGTGPSLTDGDNAIDILSFTTYDNGTTWYGSTVGQNYDIVSKNDVLFGTRGVFGGGWTPTTPIDVNTIDYITIATPGNALDFGDMSSASYGSGATSDGTRGVFGGAKEQDPAPDVYLPRIDYITIATPGNAADFGDLTETRAYTGAVGDGTRGVIAGGHNGTSPSTFTTGTNTMDYITIATLGNAADFGDMLYLRYDGVGVSDGSRGVFTGREMSPVVVPSMSFKMEYITIATLGNAALFGDLSEARNWVAGCSDGSRGIIAGGQQPRFDTIDYITIATPSTAIDFGNLTAGRSYCVGCSDGSRGIIAGGNEMTTPPSSSTVNTIDYITIATTGNATDFGDLTVARDTFGAVSGD